MDPMIRRPRPCVPTLVFAIGMAIGLAVATPSPASAQEFRLTAGNASAPMTDLVGGNGWGWGVRYFFWEGLGVGIDRDHYRNQEGIRLEYCPDGQSSCQTDTFDFDTNTNTTTLIVLAALQARDDLFVRFGGGRSASSITTSVLGRETGLRPEVPQADEGRGPIAWSRGADGNVLVFEVLWNVPRVPGPFPLSLYGAFRRHDVRMSGCGDGFTPLCGQLNHREFQIGGHLHLTPRRGRR